jgi:hypothetical protein
VFSHYFLSDHQPDQVDKDCISLSNHILKSGCHRSLDDSTGYLTHYCVIYPYKSKYLKVFAAQNLSTLIQSCNSGGDNSHQPFKFFNNCNIKQAFTYFYKLTNLIVIDIDGQSRQAALTYMDVYNQTSGSVY